MKPGVHFPGNGPVSTATAKLCESFRVAAERRVHGSQETAELLHLAVRRGNKVRAACPVFAHVMEQLPQRPSSSAVKGQDDRVRVHDQDLRGRDMDPPKPARRRESP